MINKAPQGKNRNKNPPDLLEYVLKFLFLAFAGYMAYKFFSEVKGIGLSVYLNLVLNNFMQLGWMLLLAAIIIILVGISILLQGLLGKWRRVKVFLSYQHQHAALVTKLEAVLKTKWIKPDFIPFLPADHDTIIALVQKSIEKSDLLVILPGSEKSFVDAEIMLASSLKKPIFFLKITEDQRIPDTSYRGYPVFDLQKLENYQFRPLNRFILYVTKSSKDVLLNFPRTLVAFYNQFDSILPVLGFMILLWIVSGPIIFILANLEWRFKISEIFFWIFTTIVTGYFIFRYIKIITERMRAISVTRQTIRTGNMTYELLADCFVELEADREILHCINKDPLSTKH